MSKKSEYISINDKSKLYYHPELRKIYQQKKPERHHDVWLNYQ